MIGTRTEHRDTPRRAGWPAQDWVGEGYPVRIEVECLDLLASIRANGQLNCMDSSRIDLRQWGQW
jgi:hypothetical protein